jgi:hypothetical protein
MDVKLGYGCHLSFLLLTCVLNQERGEGESGAFEHRWCKV